MANRDNYLFALSFIAKDESGLALVSAPNATTAFQILKNEGRYNYESSQYILLQSRNMGLFTCHCPELMLESYTNAVVAYEKLVAMADTFVGPPGKDGKDGADGEPGPPGSDAEVTLQNIQRALGYTPVSPSDISQFITKTVDDLTNYYLKSETYTKAEVEALVAGISGVSFVVANSLPTASASTMGKIYLIPSADPQTQNVKDEFITLESGGSYSWEQIGSTAIDLDGYVTDEDLATALADYVLSSSITDVLRYSSQSLTTEQQTQARTNIGAGTYSKPSGGIPSSDMASAVQTSLGKADSAYQKPSGGIPSTDLASAVQTSLGKADSAYQKPGTGIPSTDLASAVQTSLGKADTALQSFTETDPTVPSWAKAQNPPTEIFWATYGTTTAAEIDAALNAGKIVVMLYSNKVYFVTANNATNYLVFTSPSDDTIFNIRVNRSDSSYGNPFNLTYEQAARKKSTITGNESSDAYYPTTKAVADAISNVDKIFVAVYGTTTYQQISDAYGSGKVVVVIRNNAAYSLVNIDASYAYFGAIYSNNVKWVRVKHDNTWSEGFGTMEVVSNKVNTISGNESATNKYPSTKAVADYVNGIVGDIETLLAAI